MTGCTAEKETVSLVQCDVVAVKVASAYREGPGMLEKSTGQARKRTRPARRTTPALMWVKPSSVLLDGCPFSDNGDKDCDARRFSRVALMSIPCG